MYKTTAANSLLRAKVAGVGLGLALFATPAFADSITPDTFSATIGVGGSASVDKTVVVNAGPPTTAQADIFFMSDTTGSMGGLIAAVQGGASTILSNTAAFGSAGQIQWGVGYYNDPAAGVQQTITSNQPNVQTAINAWSASGGADYPENGLQGAIDAATGGGWRVGSQHIIVAFGDAPWHIASDGDPNGYGVTYPTVAAAEAALAAQNIKVIAVNVGGINDNGVVGTITADTGGSIVDGTGSIDATAIANLITSTLGSAFASYSNVTLDLSEVPAGLLPLLGCTTAGGCSGSFTREADGTFTFDLSFVGLAPGDYTFNVYALVDGGRVAVEGEHIIVTGAGETPLPGTAALMLSGLAGLGALVRRRKQKKKA